jgi:hypothetical protein
VIKRWARLERIRGRQLERARAEVARAAATVVQREHDLATAEGDYLALTDSPCEAVAIEQAIATIDGSRDAIAGAVELARDARARATVAARAWQRADVALTRAKDEVDRLRQRDDARAQDEHAARNHR